MRNVRVVSLWAFGALACLPSCTGRVQDTQGPGSDGLQTPGAPGGPGGRPNVNTPGTPGATNLPWPAASDGQPSVLRRLSRDEIVTTMTALVGVAPPRDSLPLDRRVTAHAQHTNTGAALIAQDIEKLFLAVDGITASAGSTGLTRSGCKSSGAAQRDCLSAYAVDVSQRAFRRSLTTVEKDRMKAIFAAAGASTEDDAEAVTHMVRAVFLSASFLYRSETGTEIKDRPEARSLSSETVAVRLAFLATLGPPDAALLDSARTGALLNADERVRQLERLLATPQGKHAMSAFVLEHLGASESYIQEKSAKYLAGLSGEYAVAARSSALSAIAASTSSTNGVNLGAVLTSRTWVNDASLAGVRQPLGATKGTPDFGNERVGLLMHPYVLAAHTKDNGVSPFTIGIFLREALLCDDVPSPPANAVMMARSDPPAGMSIRQELEYRTNASPVCAGCHSTFAPLGYAFLPFDPVGRWVQQDPTGKPWDLNGKVTLSNDETLEFNGPAELMRQLAAHPQVHGCFAQAAFTWAFGRRPMLADQKLLAALADASLASKGGVPDVFATLVRSPDFLTAIVTR